jgi:hypothetical protein
LAAEARLNASLPLAGWVEAEPEPDFVLDGFGPEGEMSDQETGA